MTCQKTVSPKWHLLMSLSDQNLNPVNVEEQKVSSLEKFFFLSVSRLIVSALFCQDYHQWRIIVAVNFVFVQTEQTIWSFLGICFMNFVSKFDSDVQRHHKCAGWAAARTSVWGTPSTTDVLPDLESCIMLFYVMLHLQLASDRHVVSTEPGGLPLLSVFVLS